MKYLNIIFMGMLYLALSSSVAMGQIVEYVGSYDAQATVRSICVVDDYAYVAVGSSGLQIIDISDPENPVYTGNFITSGSAYDVYVSGDYAYVAAGYSGLQVVNISDPANPAFVGGYNTPDRARGIYISGDYAYVADKTTLQIINVSDPEHPEHTGDFGVSWADFRNVSVLGNYAYISMMPFGLVVIDLSDLENPYCISELQTPGVAYDICISGDYAYMADETSLLSLWLLIPAEPIPYGHCDDLSLAKSVYASDDYVYVADFEYGLKVIDASNPLYLSLAASYETSGNVSDVFVSEEYVFMAEELSLLILRYTRVDIEDELNLPQEFSLAENYPNPFNNSTVISYELKQAAAVRLEIYDLLGRLVETLVDENQQAGSYQITWNAEDVSSGAYFYKMQADDYSETKRMMLLK